MTMTPAQREAVEALKVHGNKQAAADALGISRASIRRRLDGAQKSLADEEAAAPLADQGYNLSAPDRTPEEAWNSHADTFERTVSKVLRNRWRTIQRGKGAFCIFHSTDEHLDDDKTPLRLIEADIKAAHGMNAIMCHGGDALNNWPMAGRLAKQWAEQQCTAPDALLRLQHFISIFKPDVWTDGNHEEMNPYLDSLISSYLPKDVIRDYWSVNFVVDTPDGRSVRAVMSHKFQKGSSWFHPHHGFLRETLEGEEADLYMEGHLHISGWLYRTLPERGISSLGVASAGYKVVDKYAARISRGGKIPKLKGRAHWVICDPQAEKVGTMTMPFDCPVQAEAYLNSLQNLRAV